MKEAQKIFKALSDPTRLKIIILLLDGEECVCDIFPNVKRTQSTVSIQLKKLENWGLISSRRKGKYIFYSIRNKKIRAILKSAGVNCEDLCKRKTKRC